MAKTIKQDGFITDKSQLLDYFFKGCKSKENFKIGMEFEKIGVRPYSFEAVPYSGEYGIKSFLNRLNEYKNWEPVYENENILGLIKDSDSISLEPGSQFEFSCSPKDTVHEIYECMKAHNSLTAELGEEFDIKWLGYGIQPRSVNAEIELIPKERYKIMNEYLPDKASMSRVMMRETAGIQVSIDFASEKDAVKKLKVSLGIMPVMTAIFANSPIRGHLDTGYKSFRAFGWLHTDNDRCGLVSRKVFSNNFSFEEYVDTVLDLPMIFLMRGAQWLDADGKFTFRDYLNNGFDGHQATFDDWFLHMSSFFPDVRLKNYLELRNTDCQGEDLIPAIPALWKGIMYDDNALDAAWDLVRDLSWEQRTELSNQVVKHALNTRIDDFFVADIAKELVNISIESLKKANRAKNVDDESVYLHKLAELVGARRSPADVIVDLWHNSWNKNLEKLIEYTALS